MISFSFNRKKTLSLVSLVVLHSFSAYPNIEAQAPSRKIKRIDQVHQTVRALPEQQQVLPSQTARPQTAVPTASPFVQLPPAVTPLMAMALLQLLMQQQNPQYVPSQSMLQASAETFGDPAPATESTPQMTSQTSRTFPEQGSVADQGVTPQADSDVQAEALPAVKPEDQAEVRPQVRTEAVPQEPAQDASQGQVRSEQNQCSSYAGAGEDVGKSAGAISIGSGSCNTEVIGMDYVITNSHCLEGSRGQARVVFGLGRGQSKKAFPCQAVEARNPKNRLDYAVIRCPGVGKHFPPVTVANRTPKVGEPIRIATHNFSGSGRVTKLTNSGKILSSGIAPGQSMATSAYGEPGNSGSGIYDKDGNWLGLLWGGIHDRGGRPTFFSPAYKIMADLENRYPQVAQKIRSDSDLVAACQNQNAQRKVAQQADGVQ